MLPTMSLMKSENPSGLPDDLRALRDGARDVDRNMLALILSVVPGLGHLLKHYYGLGFTILIVGNALMIFIAAWLALATFGVSLIAVPIIWIASIAWSAYLLPDRHRPEIATPPPRMTEDGHFRHRAEGQEPGRYFLGA